MPRKYKNISLFFLSLVFYFYGSGQFIWLLGFLLFLNFILGRTIYYSASVGIRRILLAIGCSVNVLVLFYYKYLGFVVSQLNSWFSMGLSSVSQGGQFPLGISFCTFIAISYLVETYRRSMDRHPGFFDFGMFMCFFPHLVAGPIVRYTNIEKDVESHSLSLDLFYEGVCRFSVGLAKKIILANDAGFIADKIFSLPLEQLTCEYSWIGAICYTFQIYYDFSGYSDMAIGLGMMFGFHFPENFRDPYRAVSVTDFWKRWHITLSLWLRDFLYIPLGGNRCGNLRTYFNLVIVFIVCGLWHGAAWTFVLWGLYHGLLLIFERFAKHHFDFEPSGLLGNVYTFLAVMVGWISFRSTSFPQAERFISELVNFSGFSFQNVLLSRFTFDISHDKIIAVLACAIIAFFPFRTFVGFYRTRLVVSTGVRSAFSMAILVVTMLKLSASGYNPFIYSNF